MPWASCLERMGGDWVPVRWIQALTSRRLWHLEELLEDRESMGVIRRDDTRLWVVLSVMRIVGCSVGRTAPSASKFRSALPSFFLPATVGWPRMRGIMVGMESTTLEGFVPGFLVCSTPVVTTGAVGPSGLSAFVRRCRPQLCQPADANEARYEHSRVHATMIGL